VIVVVQLLDRRIELEEECKAENVVRKSSRSVRMVKYDLKFCSACLILLLEGEERREQGRT
jgi:hypothetical protein